MIEVGLTARSLSDEVLIVKKLELIVVASNSDAFVHFMTPEIGPGINKDTCKVSNVDLLHPGEPMTSQIVCFQSGLKPGTFIEQLIAV